jgi:hypothetical protein
MGRPVREFYYPLPNRMEPVIGRFFLMWGTLEAELDCTFAVLFQTHPTLAICLYANLGTRAKLDIISSTINMLAPVLPKDTVSDAKKMIGEIRNLNGTARNALAHGQPWIFDCGEDCEECHGQNGGHWWLTRLSAREALDVAVYPADVKHWKTLTAAVIRCAAKWGNYVTEMHEALKRVSPERLDEVCTFQWRGIESAYRARRRRPRPKTPGSSGRLANRK